MSLGYHNILVAVDGSKSAECAFKKAVQIAKRNDAKLTLIHVIDTRSFVAIDSYNGTMAQRAEKYAEELLNEYKLEAEAYGIPTLDTIVEYGSPKVVIPKQTAKTINADLIICGATGLNAVERLLIGSVSEQITRSASCDVLVVRTVDDEKVE
ncbi:universal stress protein [Lederbergia citrea]|uniref:Universal stress protein n=1 Tax=Lederbergia citrea TaxID=2833581 RepID=A0A942UJS1_9BACI|nr:universal stress protein [Lederbergia citrea]MBS4176042.1 universal stress protein [Lederbergia citrea]MBS4202604.1 universal stress protein [Lederbergia citrea]MBS4222730.1 universal stress protein [Lederbergia citrea]